MGRSAAPYGRVSHVERSPDGSDFGPPDGGGGQLLDRLMALADDPAPQLRAVLLTLLIKATDDPQETAMIQAMVQGDGAGDLLDRAGATAAREELGLLLGSALTRLAADHGEAHLARVLRDYLSERMDEWAERTVDDADNRRRAARLMVLADDSQLLAAAQRRGFMAGMSAEDVRAFAEERVAAPVRPETATELWTQLERWRERRDLLLGEEMITQWESCRP